MRIRYGELPDSEAPPLALVLPGCVVARVVVGEDHHFVAGFQVDAVRDRVVRLARVARDDDLLGRDPEEFGQRLTRRFLPCGELPSVLPRRVGVHVLGDVVERLQYRRARWT